MKSSKLCSKSVSGSLLSGAAVNSSSQNEKAAKISFLYTLAMIADEKAARQKNHEKRTVFHGFFVYAAKTSIYEK